MDKIWAPWRVKYILKEVHENKGCLFCRIAKEKKDAKNYVVVRSKYSYSVLNIYPYNNGHTLIVPDRHVDCLSKLKKEERNDLLDLLDEIQELIQKILKPQGFNIGINIGRSAGAGYPRHLHIHIVPRWRGDANFMPVVAQTKVISQSLRALYKELKHAHQRRLRRT